MAVWLGTGEAAAEASYGLRWSATLYATNAAVALGADRSCQGAGCSERYYSLVPVLGGLAQVSHAGVKFHDQHHGELCVLFTVAAVAGQTLGIAAYAADVPLAVQVPGGWVELSIVPYVHADGRAAAGLGLAWIQ
jgi:hypothetical protein